MQKIGHKSNYHPHENFLSNKNTLKKLKVYKLLIQQKKSSKKVIKKTIKCIEFWLMNWLKLKIKPKNI